RVDDVREPRAGCKLDERGQRLAVAPAAGQLGGLDAERAPGRIDEADAVDRARFEDRVRAVARLVIDVAHIQRMAGARPHPAVARDDDRQRLVDHLALEYRAVRLLDLRAARVPVLLGVGADLLRDELLHLRPAAEQAFQLPALALQLLQLGFDLDAFEPRELAQPDFQDVFRLRLGELELLHQIGLGLVGVADDLDHPVDVEQDDDPPLEDVYALLDLPQAVLQPARHRGDAELDPLADELRDVLAHRAPVEAQRHQVHRKIFLEARVREHEAHELLGILARGAGLEHEPQLVFLVRLVVYLLE